MLRVFLLALLLTTTANAQWQILDAHTTADFRGVSSVGKGIVWISGTNGTVLRSEDAGYLWQHCTTPPDAEHLDFRGIQAFDSDTAIVMSSGKGDLSRLYKTTDGCQTWKLVFTNPDKDGFWDGMRFVSRKGALIGDPVDGKFAIFESYDAGETWARFRRAQAKAGRGEAVFAASNSAILPDLRFVTGGQSGSHAFYVQWQGHSDLYFGSAPSSATYERLSLPMKKASSAGAFSIASRPGPGGSTFYDYMIVGGDYQHPDSDGSSVFWPTPVGRGIFLGKGLPLFGCCISPTTPPHGYRSAVAYDEPTKTWITVGPNGTDISTDDGRNWHTLKPSTNDAPDADKNWNALSLPFVVGPHGHVGMIQPDALKH
jgi:hypothetical protein